MKKPCKCGRSQWEHKKDGVYCIHCQAKRVRDKEQAKKNLDTLSKRHGFSSSEVEAIGWGIEKMFNAGRGLI